MIKKYNKSRTEVPHLREHKGNKRGLAISQIIIILLGTIAFSYILGSEIGFVSAAGTMGDQCTTGSDCVSNYCTPQGHCADATSHLISNGYQCGSNPECLSNYCEGSFCKEKPATTNLANGATCTSDPQCSSGLCNMALTPHVCSNCPSGYPFLCTSAQTCSGGSSIQKSGTCCDQQCTTESTSTTPSTTTPTTGGSPSGAGTSVYMNCLQEIMKGNYLDMTDCLNVAKSLLTSGGGGTTPTPSGGPTTTPSGNWQGKGIGANILNIIGAVGEAIAIYGALKALESAIPALANLDPTSAASAWLNLGEAALSGASFGGSLAINALIFGGGINAVPAIFGLAGWGAAAAWAGVGVAAAIALYLIFYKQYTVKAVVFTCIPWQAPAGGTDCRKCGQNGLPCGEYQCQSLGQGCSLLNSGQNGKELCENINEGDTVPPIMTFFDELPEGYSASPLGASVVSTTGDTGVLITSSEADGKIPPSTLLTVGVTTDEPSRCGISLVRLPLTDESGQDTINQLTPMSAGLFEYNHSFILNSPGPDQLFTSSGDMNLYMRCKDANGNNATAYFVIELGVSDIPDTSPPVIIRSDLPDNTPLPFEIASTKLPIYVSDASGVAECKWDHNNRAYDEMNGIADCTGTGTGLITSGANTGLYKCIANLDGIVDGQINTFYFRCKDTLDNVHSGTSPFTLHLIGTQSLAITSANPNNNILIKGSSDPLKVTLTVQTSAGSHNDGTSTCYYNNTLSTNKYVPFDNTNSYQSSHEIWLTTGNYVYPIKCVDSAGNAAYSQVDFRVEIDHEAPLVVRASHENANLNIKTNEEAKCVYDIVDCNYPLANGISMPTTGSLTHSAGWVGGRTYYIKCKDLFNNEPSPNSCSAILSSSQI
jgi:hypothetical protein